MMSNRARPKQRSYGIGTGGLRTSASARSGQLRYMPPTSASAELLPLALQAASRLPTIPRPHSITQSRVRARIAEAEAGSMSALALHKDAGHPSAPLAQASTARCANPDSLPWVFERLTDKEPAPTGTGGQPAATRAVGCACSGGGELDAATDAGGHPPFPCPFDGRTTRGGRCTRTAQNKTACHARSATGCLVLNKWWTE